MFPTNNVVDVEPKELHFAVIGNLSIQLEAYGLYNYVYLDWDKGHYTAHNNWWLAFSSGATNKGLYQKWNQSKITISWYRR